MWERVLWQCECDSVRMSCGRECCGNVSASDNSMSCESEHCGTVSVTVSGCHVGESVVAL